MRSGIDFRSTTAGTGAVGLVWHPYVLTASRPPALSATRELKYCEACKLLFVRAIELKPVKNGAGEIVFVRSASVVCRRCIVNGATQHSEFKAPPLTPKTEGLEQLRFDEERRFRRRGAAQPRTDSNRRRAVRSYTSVRLDEVLAAVRKRGQLTAHEINEIMRWSNSYFAAHYACDKLGLVTLGFVPSHAKRGKRFVCSYGLRPENYVAPPYTAKELSKRVAN